MFLLTLSLIQMPPRSRPSNWFIVTTLYLVLAFATPSPGIAANRKVDLTPNVSAGDLNRIKVVFELNGNLKLDADAPKPAKNPVQVKAELVYLEKTIKVNSQRRASSSAVRSYESAKATIQYREGALHPSVRDERNIVAVSTSEGGNVVLFSPLGPLNRDELELIDVPANSAIIDTILPRRSVAVKEKWKLKTDLLAELLSLDAVSKSNIECTLDRVEGASAVVHMKGKIEGAADGVASSISLAAKYTFDTRRRRITWFAMSVKENRAVGHAHPGLEATARLQMLVTKRSSHPSLHSSVLADLNLEAEASSELLEFRSPSGGFEMLMERNWQVMIERADLTVVRLVDRGDLVAQCNISSLAPLGPTDTFTIVEFQQDVKRALDKNFGEFVTASESLTDSGLHVMRVVASGEISELSIDWVYYHISDDSGRRASCVYTYESSLADQFGAADQTLISSFQFCDKADSKSPESQDSKK